MLSSCWVETLTSGRETEKLGNKNTLTAICLENVCKTPRVFYIHGGFINFPGIGISVWCFDYLYSFLEVVSFFMHFYVNTIVPVLDGTL